MNIPNILEKCNFISASTVGGAVNQTEKLLPEIESAILQLKNNPNLTDNEYREMVGLLNARRDLERYIAENKRFKI